MTDEEIGSELLRAKKEYERWSDLYVGTKTYKRRQRVGNIGMTIAILLAIPAGILLARYFMSLIIIR
ncbi:MAG: hypothetical protein KAI64_05935 [Thermoplasmata archaeon]|nr:hypothetical protein [Thermoplasmata archaeon]